MNKVNVKSLLHSKWTKMSVTNKEKHFVITELELNEDKRIVRCVIQAVINHTDYEIDWRDLKNSQQWRIGWQ
jgi:tryptophan-rich hypothetical protein